MSATCPDGGATADTHDLSRTTCQQTRRSTHPRVAALQRHRLPKLIVQVMKTGLAGAPWTMPAARPQRGPGGEPGTHGAERPGPGQGRRHRLRPPALNQHLSAILTVRAPAVVLDLSRLTFLDCAALRVLVAVERRAAAYGTTLVLAAPRPTVARTWQITDRDRQFTVFPRRGGSCHRKPDWMDPDRRGPDGGIAPYAVAPGGHAFHGLQLLARAGLAIRDPVPDYQPRRS